MKRTLVLAALVLVIGAAPAAAAQPAGCPVGVWERVGKDGQRLTLTIAPDHLRLKGADEKGTLLLLLEGDHRVTKDSILFGIVTSVESHGAGVFGESGKAIWALPVDTLFSWHFRVDGDTLTVKDARPETPSFDLAGRFKRKACCKGKLAACPKASAEPCCLTGYLYSVLANEGMIAHSSMPFSIYVKGVQGRKLLNAVFKRKDKNGQFDIVANAREAEVRIDTTRPSGPVFLIRMHDGVASSEGGVRASFENRTFEVPLHGNGAEKPTGDK
jgi:hypothetical protein